MNIPTVREPRIYQWPANEYIAVSHFFKYISPQIRTRTAIKAAFNKSFAEFDRKAPYTYTFYNQSDLPRLQRLKSFGMREIYRTTGELIFECESPIMIAYAREEITQEEVLEAIDW